MTHNELKIIGILHNVILPKMISIPDQDFSVSETVITVEQYKSYCIQKGIYFPEQSQPYRDNNPVTKITYYEAVTYTEWLSEITGEKYCLPTEEEFIIYIGDHTKANKDIAVYSENSIKPVKTKQSNKYGLYDCLGLVWEWTSSLYNKQSTDRVFRGGSWLCNAVYCRSACRDGFEPSIRGNGLGFRVICKHELTNENRRNNF